tara:strand:+ start:2338 stop:3189 length:852 start_codon:yes stop_codon:yes gene_type:complete
MAIPNKQSARKIAPMRGVDGFLGSMLKNKRNAPATLNKWTISFATPPILQPRNVGGDSTSDKMVLEKGDPARMLDYYAMNVGLPSRQITAAQFQPPGASVRYATNQAFSEMSIEFMIPRSQYTRSIFETWVNRISRDSNQYVDFYDRYCSPKVRIYKWETTSQNINQFDVQYRSNSLGELTGCWEMQNVFPYNIGSIQLNNEQNTLMSLSVGFYYERYRFFTADEYSDYGKLYPLTLPAGLGLGSLSDEEKTQIVDSYTVSGVTYATETGQPIAFAESYGGPT